MSLGYLTASVLVFVLAVITNERCAEKRRRKATDKTNNWLTDAVGSSKDRAEEDDARTLSVNAERQEEGQDERA